MLKTILTIFVTTVFLSACQNFQKNNDISYVVLERYFVKNTVTEFNNHKIKSKEEFDSNFGMAAVMGENGRPTDVDFSKQYVIAIVKPETNLSTTITPVGLTKSGKDEIVFTYKVETGEENSYTIRPALLIAIDKTNDGEVVLNEVK